MYHMLISR